MSLVSCYECEHEVSSKASKCPNCGANLESKVGLVFWGGVGAIMVVIFLLSNLQERSPYQESSFFPLGEKTKAVQNDSRKSSELYENCMAVPRYLGKEEEVDSGQAERSDASCWGYIKGFNQAIFITSGLKKLTCVDANMMADFGGWDIRNKFFEVYEDNPEAYKYDDMYLLLHTIQQLAPCDSD